MTETISVSGAIVIKACFDKLQCTDPERLVKIIVPSNKSKDKIKQILQHIGLKDYGLEITHDDILRWIVKIYDTGISKSNLMQEIDEPIQKLTNWKNETDEIKHIREAIPEACWNSFEHGYRVRDDNIPKAEFTKAYLIFGITEKDYSFCIFDRGIGFRGSFQYYYPNRLKDLVASMIGWEMARQERRIIEEAIGKGSKAKGLGRGSGLPGILESVTKSLRGRVIIHSLSGYYQNTPEGDEKIAGREDIKGTLVQFAIPIVD